jgi:hypothetical protein
MVDFTSTQARAKGVAPSTNHEEVRLSLWLPNPRTPHIHQLSMGWTGCTFNWQGSMPSSSFSSLSALAGTELTQLLVWLGPRSVGRGPPQHLPRQGWHHHRRSISRPWPHCGDMAGVSNPDVPPSSLGERDHTQNPRQDEHIDIFRYTIEELRSITNQYTTSNEVAALHPAQGSREVTPRSSKETMSGVAVYSTKVGAKGGKKRHKQYPLGATTTADRDDGSYGKAGGSSARRITTATHNDKRQARPPMDHFRRLLEEAYPIHVYPVRHKLKDCDMMKSFMISGYFTQGTELEEDLGGSNTMPFPMEDTIMIVYGGRLLVERSRMSKLSLGPPTCCSVGRGSTGS